jgi:hypothetical protein
LALKGFSARQQTMEFGVQFFPAVGPALKSPAQYWGEALHLAEQHQLIG